MKNICNKEHQFYKLRRIQFNYIFLKGLIPLVLIIIFPIWMTAQSNSTIKEFEKNYITYPFSDPDSVPNQGKIYPYFRYDGYTVRPVQKEWKVVELENDYISVQIMPEIGGKIWTAIDKKNGKPFIYNNGVVKFRDVALRGPFTSGGIEHDFGIVGHGPTVSGPIDYITRKNDDGSVSCIVGALDLLTRSRWNVEIRLPKNKAYFITHTYWHNTTSIEQSYYTWENMAIKATDSLKFIESGTHYVEHDGSSHPWPFDSILHKDLSIYKENGSGVPGSKHIFGTYSKYFGAYWPEENFGIIHFAEREDKLGKKIFTRSLADEGIVRMNLLTDKSGQLLELQSGRLFNQNPISSSYTPFKQVGFSPFQTDSWTEYWYPFAKTKGVTIADLNGVINLQQQADSLLIFISPVSKISDTLKLYDKFERVIYQKKVNIQPLQPFYLAVYIKANEKVDRLYLNGTTIKMEQDKNKQLDRPANTWPNFNWNSAYGLYLLGRDEGRTRDYASAEDKIRQSLKMEPTFLPSLTEMAFLKYRKMEYDSSYYFAKNALRIDTYNPEANYYYGLAAEKLGKIYDALDGFEVACLNIQLRSAAYTEMSKIHIQNKNYDKAFELAGRSMGNNSKNVTALQMRYVAARLMGKPKDQERIKREILQIDPLNHFIHFEQFWANKDDNSKNAFLTTIKNELPQETYLELAIWYYGINRLKECETILDMAPENNEIAYWQAYLHKNKIDVDKKLDDARKGTAMMVFPFREETAKVMEWAMQQTTDWKPSYYLALIENFRNNDELARKLLEKTAGNIDFAPFYITRALLCDSLEIGKKLKDFSKAVELDKTEWRYGKYLATYFLENKKNVEALKTIKPYFIADSNNFNIAILYGKCLMLNDKYTEAEKIWANIQILPSEGSSIGHTLYRQNKLMLALNSLKKDKYELALQKVKEAREWPHNLGIGKPYPDLINTELEDSLQIFIYKVKGDKGQISEKDYNHLLNKIRKEQQQGKEIF